MKKLTLYTFSCFLILSFSVSAQISPGELSRAHANLEGISNCTKCHVLGEKITNDRCLNCHTEIKELAGKKRGYHADPSVASKSCASCHSDHHGRNFKIINFTKENFDHQKTGYELLGKHKTLDCTKCHKPEFIRVRNSKKSGETYLGLESACLNCHTDYHRKTLPQNCASCHDFNSFKPAPKFDHQQTKFPLNGKHAKVDCAKCHKILISANQKFQQFSGIPSSNCTNCHKDVHDNKFGQNCRKCHSEESFQRIVYNAFDHTKTNYPLTGRHLSVSCNACHKTGFNIRINHSRCTDCHLDFHKNQFTKNGSAPDCSECHTTTGFSPSTFTTERHNRLNYTLDGSHLKASCSSCHKPGKEWIFKDLKTDCSGCHADYHEKEFSIGGKSPDCSLCHTTVSFQNTIYTVDQHNSTGFKLEGAHLATPCFSCHKEGNKWKFVKTGKNCVDCHPNIHQNTIDQMYYPGQDCRVCHRVSKWSETHFDHGQTGFPLSGKHELLSCIACHKVKDSFNGLTKNCVNCHKDVHNHQFDEKGTCTKCHDTRDWKANLFNHDQTGFKLGNSHRNVSCNKCHTNEESPAGTYVKYKIAKTKCADCHS